MAEPADEMARDRRVTKIPNVWFCDVIFMALSSSATGQHLDGGEDLRLLLPVGNRRNDAEST
jgi:hypothetical protein